MWEGSSISIPPFSVVPFYAKVSTGSISGSFFSLDTIILNGNVFTTVGEFGKAGYGTALNGAGPEAIPNVYLSTVANGTANSETLVNMTGIQSGSTIRLNATLADLSTNALNEISSGSRLIINVPKDWENPTLVNWGGFSSPTVTAYPDNSHQIIGTLTGAIVGDDNLGRTIQFDVTAPTVTSPQMYVMYILADGSTNNSFSIAPLAEIVLQVVPP